MFDTTLQLPSIGLGTYNHCADEEELVSYSVQRGYRLIDTAPNYNNGKAQSQIGNALHSLRRDEVIVSTKAGFASKSSYLRYIAQGKVQKDTFAGYHSLDKTFLHMEVQRSLTELRTNQLDVLFIHNPERQLERTSKQQLVVLLSHAFEMLENLCELGMVKAYGVSTWDGFGLNGKSEKFSLDELLEVAVKVNGRQHHFRFIQLPLSLVNFEELYNCKINNHGLLKCAQHNNVGVVANSPLHRGELPKLLDETFVSYFGLKSKALACLSFLKSFTEIDTILVGATNKHQIDENYSLMDLNGLSSEKLEELLMTLHDYK